MTALCGIKVVCTCQKALTLKISRKPVKKEKKMAISDIKSMFL